MTGLVGRLVARLHGEVAAHALESYRRAGLQVHELADQLGDVCQDVLVSGGPLPESVRIALLCGWNAFVLQAIGDHLLAEDALREPLTAGYVPPPIAAEALGMYGPVAGWLSRAQQALHNEHYELDVTVPAALPPWATSGARLGEHGATYRGALRAALARLEAHADRWSAMTTSIEREPVGDRAKRARGIVRQVRVEVATASEYATALCAGCDVVDGDVAVDVEAQVKLALERLFVHGQLVADPSLALAPLPRPTVLAKAGRAAPLAAPDDPAFDPWCLTDPRRVAVLRAEAGARDEVQQLWDRDPDPVRTLALKADIDRAVVLNRVGYGVGHFHRCPWPAIYVAKQPLRIGRAQLHPLQEFTLVVEADGRKFRRAVEVGPFHPSEAPDA